MDRKQIDRQTDREGTAAQPCYMHTLTVTGRCGTALYEENRVRPVSECHATFEKSFDM